MLPGLVIQVKHTLWRTSFMTHKQKTYAGAGVMAVLTAGLVFGHDFLYDGIKNITGQNASYEAGTYMGTADGFGGSVTAKVTISDGEMESVELTGNDETPEVGQEALKALAPKFMAAGSAMVDTVAGSTVTSGAAMQAVQHALDQAAGKAEVIAVADETEKETEETKDEPLFVLTGDETAEPYEGGLRTGMAAVYSMEKSKDAGEKDGAAEVDMVVAAVVIDQEGRVADCKLDMAQTKMGFTAEGKVIMADGFKTKKELGEEYGMKKVSAIGKEWNEQAENFEAYVIGKTAEEIFGIAVDESTKPAEADLASGVTVSIGDFQNAVILAILNAEEIGTQEGDKLGLSIVTNMDKSKDAAEDADGQCQAYSTFMAVTTDAEGRTTGALIDASQGTVKFDAAGKITSDIQAGVKTKRQLGDAYGMRNASAIGKEWFEQADAFENYMTGKTAEEISGIAVTEDGKAADADLASGVTVAIGDFQAAAAKAFADAE